MKTPTARALRHAVVATAAAAVVACGGSQKPAPEPPPATLAPAPVAPVQPKATPLPTPPPSTVASVPSPQATQPKPPVTTASKAHATPPPPPPTAAPKVDAARVAAILVAAQALATEGKWREAATQFDDALALDPENAAAQKGKAKVSTALLGLKRTFVPDLASSEGAEGRLKTMQGFDEVEEQNVRRAARVPGRAELDSTAGHVKPGDPYKVDIFIRNLSPKKKKNIKISNVSVKRIVNDKEVKVPVEWKGVMVEPKQRALVATVTGTWEDDVSSWILDVKLLAEESNDIYENRVVWK